MDNARFPAESPASASTATGADIEKRIEHRYVENEVVKIHYAALGEGPLIVMLHAFPEDYWYTWRYQMAALSGSLKDPYLLPSALNDTWEWVGSDLTLVTIPDAGHFVQQDAA